MVIGHACWKCLVGDECFKFSTTHPSLHGLVNRQKPHTGFGGYLRSIYFALVAMSTVGYGDIAPKNIVEISFAAVFILIGGLALPAVIGGISVYILNFGMTAKLFR